MNRLKLPDNRFTSRLASRLYVLGIISGCGYFSERGKKVVAINLDLHPRPYVLGWQRTKWGCLFKRHHWPYWPEGRPVVFGLCGKCVPWPCCGSIEFEHATGCVEVPA